MNKFLPVLFLLFFSVFVNAGFLVTGAKITKVGSTNWDKKVFYIEFSGGAGPCANGSANFPEEYAQSIVAYAQMHGMAMSAFLHDKTVNVYNYGDRAYSGGNVCTGANSISIE